ncbi:DUF2726 domain-containing protein [Thalassotalea sp. G2M2-11]|uniref:DUF2726 domain-containing protein n=1 Tax=Thalassotalea sp. G2M2-11 TaxID=2787627 RepID=UPI0019D2589B|nr:DUF2726 domain-containing protein [Thalassotalea sp. G2M2-11]
MELILFAMISLVVIVALLASRLNDNSFPFPFDKKAMVFTPAEKNFQNLLEQAVGENYRIINRVKLSDIVTVRNGVSTRASQTAVNNADNKYLDFVICEKQNMKLLGGIDLVDTNGKGYKVKKDWFVSGAMEAAGIPHLRIKVKNNYSIEEIRACIKNRIIGNNTKAEPKIKGRVIPAPLVKARPKSKNQPAGVISSAAAKALPNTKVAARQIPHQQPHALPH